MSTRADVLRQAIATDEGYVAKLKAAGKDPSFYEQRIALYQQELAALSTGLTRIADLPPMPPNPPAAVLPNLVAAFVAHNPALDPILAAEIAQALGQGGDSAQALSFGLQGLAFSDVIPGLVVEPGGLPVFETAPVADGIVLYNDGEGPGSFGAYVQGAFSAPAQAGHISTVVGYMFTLQGMTASVTVLVPGETDAHVGAVGSNVLDA